MRLTALATCGLAALSALGCGDSARATSGANEPLRVRNGQFFEGAFPTATGGPSIDIPNAVRTSVVTAGFTGKKIGGLTPIGSLSVGLVLEGSGHGYWVVPVGSPDTLTNELGWSALIDFASDAPTGDQILRVAAADSGGHFGKPVRQPLTILPSIYTPLVCILNH